MRTLGELFGEQSSKKIVLETLIIAAFQYPDSRCRREAIEWIREYSKGDVKINRGFVGDNLLMIEVRQSDYKELIYVSDVKEEYAGRKVVEPIPFTL